MSPIPVQLACATASSLDLVGIDQASLALHMARCARARGRLFEMRRHVQDGKELLAGRLVTVAFVGCILASSLAFAFAFAVA